MHFFKSVLFSCFRDDDRGSVNEDMRRSTESLPAKPFDRTSLSIDETLDKSTSHPNISMITSTGEQSATTSKSSSDLTKTNESPSAGESTNELTHVSSVLDQSTDELQQDIECALAQVMHGLHSLQMQQNQSSVSVPGRQSILQNKTLPSHTPDLVLDLPLNVDQSAVPQPKPMSNTVPLVATDDDSPTLTTAEVFAKSNQSTMKKGSSMPRGVINPMAANLAKLAVSASIKRSHSTAGTSSTRVANRDMRWDGLNTKGVGDSGKLDKKSVGSGDLKTENSDSNTSMVRLSRGKDRPSVPMLTARKKTTDQPNDKSNGNNTPPAGTPPRSSTPRSESDMFTFSNSKESGGTASKDLSRLSGDSGGTPSNDLSRLSADSDGSEPDQSITPQRPARTHRVKTDQSSTHDRPDRPKPPLRAKPVIMRKPQMTPSPEPLKRKSSSSVLDSNK